MQADTLLPAAQRRGYTSFFSALVRIPKEEGFTSLWRGCNPTIARAMSMNLGMLATYDECKEQLDKIRGEKDLLTTRMASSAVAGVVCAVMSLPFDNIKTKLQSMKPGADGKYQYKGVVDCFIKSIAL
jgi:solute carrier family 25 oxoglutarate transporter 11